MEDNYFEIKDRCRNGLLKYLMKAVAGIPPLTRPRILDMGCGTGVPSLALMEHFGGTVTLVDSDPKPLQFLQNKIKQKKLEDRTRIVESHFFDFIAENSVYDLLLAEGILNVVGFEAGLEYISRFVKSNGYIIIHDEIKDHEKKLAFISRCHCRLLDTFRINEGTWWKKYYQPLSEEILSIDDPGLLSLFRGDLAEIEAYRKNPSTFRSIYYLIEKT